MRRYFRTYFMCMTTTQVKDYIKDRFVVIYHIQTLQSTRACVALSPCTLPVAVTQPDRDA